MQNDNLGISIVKSALGSEAKDLAVDWGELGLDALLDEGVLKDAAMLGTVATGARAQKMMGLVISVKSGFTTYSGEIHSRAAVAEPDGPKASKAKPIANKSVWRPLTNLGF